MEREVKSVRGKLGKVFDGLQRAEDQARAGRCGRAKTAFGKAASELERLEAMRRRGLLLPMADALVQALNEGDRVVRVARLVAVCRTRRT